MTRRELKRTQWLADFEAKVLSVAPGLAGRIEWRDPAHHEKYGASPTYAAACYLTAHEDSWRDKR